MYSLNELKQQLDPASLSKHALAGAAIGLVLISIFLLNVKEPNPNWPKLWMLKPLIIVPVAGALGGAVYYAMNQFIHQRGWRKIVATIVGLLVYVIGLWLGIVLGLDGTLWN